MGNRLLLIIPAYNEEENIERVVGNIREHYPQYDYVVINDGSSDRTSEICHRLRFNVIDHPVNLGLEGAFQTGMKYAFYRGYECAVQFDADGQHRPEYIEKMYDAMREGYDVVIGSRFAEEKKPFTARMIGSRLISWAIRAASGISIADPTSGMRLYSRNICKDLAANMNYGPEPDTISFLAKKGVPIKEVQVQMDERIAGESYLNVMRSILYMTGEKQKMITMSIQLRIALILGAVMTMIAMLHQIRKKKVQIDSTIFWILFSFILVLIAVFPDIIYLLSEILGVISPANLVLAGIILILIIKMFLMTLEISELKEKIRELSQSIALRREREEYLHGEKQIREDDPQQSC